MLAINGKGILIDTGTYEKPKFYIKKYAINFLVLMWKLFFKTLAFGFSVLSFTLKVLAYLFFMATALLMLFRFTGRR